MNKLFYTASKVSRILPLSLLIKITGRQAIFPFYHLVSDENVLHVKHLYKIRSVKAFEKDLDFYLKNYKPLEFSELIDSIHTGKSIKEYGFFLTFDDGLSQFHDVIAPLLLRKGIPAICFVNSGFIDNKDLFYRYKTSILIDKLQNTQFSSGLLKEIEAWFLKNNLTTDLKYKSLLSINYLNKHYLDELASILQISFADYLQNCKPYMSSEQIVSLIKSGFIFGSHSIDHPKYSEIELDQQLIQTEISTKDITTKFNIKHKLFSFPFTDYNVSKRFFDILFDPQKPIVDMSFGSAGLKRDSCMRNIQRIPIEIENYTAREVVYGEYLYYIFKAVLNKNKIKRI